MRNYTSRVQVENTIADIEQLLVKYRARDISKRYEEGDVVAIMFTVLNPDNGLPMCVKMPANVEAAFKVLHNPAKGNSRQREMRVRRDREQAKRTAWRIVYDWISVQLTMIELRQAELFQVFMPYAWDGHSTLYERIKEGKFAALGYHPKKHNSGLDSDVLEGTVE